MMSPDVAPADLRELARVMVREALRRFLEAHALRDAAHAWPDPHGPDEAGRQWESWTCGFTSDLVDDARTRLIQAVKMASATLLERGEPQSEGDDRCAVLIDGQIVTVVHDTDSAARDDYIVQVIPLARTTDFVAA